MNEKLLDYQEATANLQEAITEIGIDDFVSFYNEICAKKIVHIEGGIFKYTGEDDTEE
jgi:hypothetical protein